MTAVSVYGVKGWEEDLPFLNTGRRDHACSSYMSGGTRVRYHNDITHACMLINRKFIWSSTSCLISQTSHSGVPRDWGQYWIFLGGILDLP